MQVREDVKPFAQSGFVQTLTWGLIPVIQRIRRPSQVRTFPAEELWATGHGPTGQKGWTQSQGPTQHPAKPLLAPNFLLRDFKLHEAQNHAKLRPTFTESGTFLKLYKPQCCRSFSVFLDGRVGWLSNFFKKFWTDNLLKQCENFSPHEKQH